MALKKFLPSKILILVRFFPHIIPNYSYLPNFSDHSRGYTLHQSCHKGCSPTTTLIAERISLACSVKLDLKEKQVPIRQSSQKRVIKIRVIYSFLLLALPCFVLRSFGKYSYFYFDFFLNNQFIMTLPIHLKKSLKSALYFNLSAQNKTENITSKMLLLFCFPQPTQYTL